MRSPAGIITTERLRLTPLVVDDANEMVTVLGDERMYEFTGGCPPSLDALRERYRRLIVGHSADGSQQWLNWVVRLTAEDLAVGAMQATLTTEHSSADVAWEIGVPWQGRGIASEAASAVVQWLLDQGVGTITAYIHPEHHASSRVAASAGLAPTSMVVDGETMWHRMATVGRHRSPVIEGTP
jgi:RimJ/RimL family protein N-acetyltransferase